MRQRKLSLTTIGPLVISAILIAVFSAIFVISSRAGSANIQEALDAVSQPILATTSKLLFNPLYNLDTTKINGILDPYVDGTTVIYAAVYDTNAAQVVEINKKWAPDIALSHDLSTQALSQTEIVKKEVGEYLILTKSIAVGTVQMGTVELVFDQAPLRTSLGKAQATISITLIVALIAVTLLFFFGFQYAVRPLNHLALIAQDISRGNLSAEIPIEGTEEISSLASAFVSLLGTVRDTIATLEERVTDRTKALSSVAEVSTVASTILETDKLLQQVVDLTKERFGFYHAHVYLLNGVGDTLVLASGAGEVGRQMVAEGRSIPLDREQSLVARAARQKKGVTVNDVTAAPDFLPNPLLPDTHSELAVPMMIGEQVIGVFDVQSEAVGRFTDSDIAVQTTLASQVASAVQNARSYTEIQNSQALLSEALNISRLANWEYDFEHDLFHFNDQFYSIFRTSVEKIGSYKISSADYARNFVHPDDQALVGSEIQRVVESKARRYSTALEHRIIFADGEVGYISVRINVERDGNGKILRWYGANQDVTERRHLEELNRKRAIQQEAINLITQKIQAATTVEEAMQVAARELGHALGQRQTLVSLEPFALSGHTKTIINE